MYMYNWKAKGISFVFCFTHIQVLNLWVNMNMIKWSLTHVSNLVFDMGCLHSMHVQQKDNFSNVIQTLLNFKLQSVKANKKYNKMECISKLSKNDE